MHCNQPTYIPLDILKRDSITGTGLSGAVFALTALNGAVLTGTTNHVGLLRFDIFPGSTYRLREISPPAGYESVHKVFRIYVDDFGCIYVDGCLSPRIVIANTAITASFTAIKINIEDGAPLAGAEYTLFSGARTVAAAVSTATGALTFTGLSIGTYELVETAPPPGFGPNTERLPLLVAEDGRVTILGEPANGYRLTDASLELAVALQRASDPAVTAARYAGYKEAPVKWPLQGTEGGPLYMTDLLLINKASYDAIVAAYYIVSTDEYTVDTFPIEDAIEITGIGAAAGLYELPIALENDTYWVYLENDNGKRVVIPITIDNIRDGSSPSLPYLIVSYETAANYEDVHGIDLLRFILQMLQTYLTSHFELFEDIEMESANNPQRETMDGETLRNWSPAGTGPAAASFTGTLNGNHHVIEHMIIYSTIFYTGMFGYLGIAGSVKNLGLVDGSVTNPVNGLAASIAGFLYTGRLDNCYNTGTIIGTLNNTYIGGIVASTNSGGTVIYCYNTGTITSIANNSTGGIVGSNGGTIENCYNGGTISGTNANASAINLNIGGIAGRSDGTIRRCYNTGPVSGTSAAGVGNYSGAGGIAGYMQYSASTITDSYNTATISSNISLGGIVGSITYGGVRNCYNIGDIEGAATISRAGGISGYLGGSTTTITSSYALNETVTGSLTLSGRVWGGGTGTGSANYAYVGMLVNGSPVISGTGSTTKQGADITLDAARLQSTYEANGWDFNEIWTMGGSVTGFPILQNTP